MKPLAMHSGPHHDFSLTGDLESMDQTCMYSQVSYEVYVELTFYSMTTRLLDDD